MMIAQTILVTDLFSANQSETSLRNEQRDERGRGDEEDEVSEVLLAFLLGGNSI